MKKKNSRIFPGPNKIFFKDCLRVHNDSYIISPKQLESTFYISFKMDDKIGKLDLFQLVLKRVT